MGPIDLPDASTRAAPQPQSRRGLWLRFVVRMLVLLWGTVPLYFITASSLGGLTEPREVLVRLVLVGGIASLLLLGLLVVVWRWERTAAWLFLGLALLVPIALAVPMGDFWRAMPLEALKLTGGAAVPPLVVGGLLAVLSSATPPNRRAAR